jgi:hypothetical protein
LEIFSSGRPLNRGTTSDYELRPSALK